MKACWCDMMSLPVHAYSVLPCTYKFMLFCTSLCAEFANDQGKRLISVLQSKEAFKNVFMVSFCDGLLILFVSLLHVHVVSVCLVNTVKAVTNNEIFAMRTTRL